MANFAEGTIKLRGRAENIKSALKYMFKAVGNVTIEEDTDGELITFTSSDSYFYINGTKRAFIDNDSFEIHLDDDFLIIELDNFEQAWRAIPDDYTKYLRNSMLTLRYSRLNKVCNLHKKLKSQKVKF